VDRPLSALPNRLAFTYQEDEARAYSRLIWARRDRGPDYGNFKALMTLITFAIGFVVLFANYLGFVTSEQMRPVLFTAYLAFFAGALAHRAAIQIRNRAIGRAMYRDRITIETFEMTFDASGVACRNATFELRVPWAAILDVVETSMIVVLFVPAEPGDANSGTPVF
jgi:hypothetical protein